MDNTTSNLYKFKNDADGWSLTMEARDVSKSMPAANGIADYMNFKNGAEGAINIPEGKSLYRIDLIGFSQSTDGNLEYLAAWGKGDETTSVHTGSYAYVAAKEGTKDNSTIKTFAYPMTADAFLDSSISGYPAPFASIDLTFSPYKGTFPVAFYGNNQIDVFFVCYTSEASAKAEYDMNAGSGSSGIANVNAAPRNNVMYNIAGQHISTAKGMYIMNGKKFIVK